MICAASPWNWRFLPDLLDTAREVLNVMAGQSEAPHVEAMQDYVKEG